MKINVNFKRLNDLAKIPTRGSTAAAGYDLYAATDESITIPPHETRKIDTGIAFEFPEGTFGAVFARSGIASKRGLRPCNCTAVIDADYRGSIIVALHNDTDVPQDILPQERIAQLVLLPFVEMNFKKVETLTETTRSDTGFGHSGRF